jgi:hypothetical protein
MTDTSLERALALVGLANAKACVARMGWPGPEVPAWVWWAAVRQLWPTGRPSVQLIGDWWAAS